MSKVSFRARTVDVSKPMPIYRSETIPDVLDYDKINRAVVQMPTGMEKEEEMETHLQKALTAQQFYGTAEARTIPIPDVQCVGERYPKLYKADFKMSRQYIHVEAPCMEQEIPDYDLDSEDDSWLQDHSSKLDITSLKFEEMMDRLEKGSGQQVVSLPEAKLLLKEDDDLIITVYDYWLNKRLRMQRPLMCQVKSEKRDGSTTNDPYVAFRRRTEKMQTRKNRKNDEVSYERMLKLRREMEKALTLVQLLKRREKSKKEMLQLNLEIVAKRYQMADFNGVKLAEAEAERAKMPSFVPPFLLHSVGHPGATLNGEAVPAIRKKRPYRRRQKLQQPPNHPQAVAAAMATAASFGNIIGLGRHELDTSDDDFLSPAASPSDQEDENDPDGLFAFKRRKLCNYHVPLYDRNGNWPWSSPQEGGKGDPRHRFSLTTLPGGRCVGFSRRRVGRGGRVILDRGFTPWDDALDDLNLTSGQSYSGQLGDYITYIREKKIPYYRPRDQKPSSRTAGDNKMGSLRSQPSLTAGPFAGKDQGMSVEKYSTHQEQLMKWHLEQSRHLSHDSAAGVSQSSNSVMDVARAQFAVSALVDRDQLKARLVAGGGGEGSSGEKNVRGETAEALKSGAVGLAATSLSSVVGKTDRKCAIPLAGTKAGVLGDAGEIAAALGSVQKLSEVKLALGVLGMSADTAAAAAKTAVEMKRTGMAGDTPVNRTPTASGVTVNHQSGSSDSTSIRVVVTSDASVTIPSSSLVSTLSVPSSTASPKSFASLPAIMAATPLSRSSPSPSAQVQQRLVVSTSSPAVPSLPQPVRPIFVQSVGQQGGSNGPVTAYTSAGAGLIHVRTMGPSTAASVQKIPCGMTTKILRLATPPGITVSGSPKVHSPSPSPTPSSLSQAPSSSAVEGMMTSSVGPPVSMCGAVRPSLTMLKSTHEDNRNPVRLFKADTSVPMDVS